MSATTNLGKVSVTPKGAWAITNAYEILDIVTSGGSSYLAKQDVPTGVPLTNTSYWIMIAEKGDGGEVTSASASISGGYGTPGVSVTAGGTAHERTLAFAFTNLRGEKGETGNGIDSVYKTGTSGLVDTYTILFTDGSTYEFEVNNGTASIDDTLTKSGWAADAKAVGDTKASIDGFYETMGVGVADNLTPYSEDSGALQDIPFIAQGTGCGNGASVVDTGSYLQFKKKLGNTVAVNQLAKELTVANWATSDGSISSGEAYIQPTSTWKGIGSNYDPGIVVGHKYLVMITGRLAASGTNVTIGTQRFGTVNIGTLTSTSNQLLVGIFEQASADAYTTISFSNRIGVANFYLKDPKIIDLTRWFGSNDRIPSDLLSHPENWGRYYAGSLDYNAGTLESADGTILTSIHRNIWDEQTELGRLDTSTGANVSASNQLRTQGYLEVNPATAYYLKSPSYVWALFYDDAKNVISSGLPAGNYAYSNNARGIGGTDKDPTFTTPPNCSFIRFYMQAGYGTTYNHDITISLYYSGESGYSEYYPHTVLAEVDTGSEVLRSAGAVADEKTPDGTITRRVGVVDLGTLTWSAQGTEGAYLAQITGATTANNVNNPNMICSRATNHYVAVASMADGDFRLVAANSNILIFMNRAYATPAAFKAAMSGVYLYYELATPTTEQGTAFAENIPCDDFGSMYWTQTKGIPQGNEIFYPVDYKASIDTLYNRVEGDMSAIVIDSQLEVVADRIPEAPSEDSTYTLKATVSSGTKTYSWVADE